MGYEHGVVAKVPLGSDTENAFVRASRMNNSVRNFSNVSPDTLIIIAMADGNVPKPIVIQKEIHGQTVCDTPIRKLFRLKTLYGMRDVVHDMKLWYWDNSCYDLCGQQTSKTLLGKAIQFIPFFSDNVMTDTNGKVFLTDNVLDAVVRTDTNKRRVRDSIRKNILHNIPVLFIDSLILAKKAYNFLSGNVENLDLKLERQTV